MARRKGSGCEVDVDVIAGTGKINLSVKNCKIELSTVFWRACLVREEGKIDKFALFILKSLRESWISSMKTWKKSGYEIKGTLRTNAKSFKIQSKYSKWMLCHVNFLDRTTYITSMIWKMAHKTILATLSLHAKTPTLLWRAGLEHRSSTYYNVVLFFFYFPCLYQFYIFVILSL